MRNDGKTISSLPLIALSVTCTSLPHSFCRSIQTQCLWLGHSNIHMETSTDYEPLAKCVIWFWALDVRFAHLTPNIISWVFKPFKLHVRSEILMIFLTKTKSFKTFFVFTSCYIGVTKMHVTEYLLPVPETKPIIILVIIRVLLTNWMLVKTLVERHCLLSHWE
jgi:hypothetical protein